MINNVLKLRELAKELALPVSHVYASLEDKPSAYIAEAAQRYGVSVTFDSLPDDKLPDGVRIAAVIPGYPEDVRDRYTLSLENAVRNCGSDAELIIRYYNPDVTIFNLFYPDDFCQMLNALEKQDPDIYVLHPIMDNRFINCAADLARHKPVIMLDGPVSNTELKKLGDAAYVGPDYFECGELAVMLMSDIIECSDYAVCISPYDFDSCETRKTQLSGGFMTGIRDIRCDEIDMAVFDIPVGMNRTPDHFATDISAYYMARREMARLRMTAENRMINGVGAVFVYAGCMDFTLRTMLNMNPIDARFFRNAQFVGVNENIDKLKRDHPSSLTDRIKLLINTDHDEACRLALSAAAKRLGDGRFDRQRYFTKYTLELLS